MRVFIAVFAILPWAHGSDIKINVPCNKELDGLLATDPDGNENAFMSCQTVGVGNIGFWERKVCPNEMVFDFINQQCKAKAKKARKQQTLNIAILNNSCANGETCIGGSVCDLDSLKCMCPFGTIPHLDTLSCESNGPAFVSAPIDPNFQFKSMGNNFNQGGMDNRFQPNPVFKFENNFKANGNMNSYGNDNSRNEQKNNFNFIPDFNFKPNWNVNNNNNGASGNVNTNNAHITNPSGNNDKNFGGMLPNPSQFIFGNNNNNFKPTVQQQKIMTLAKPGSSCKNNEVCIGNSICTLPLGACLCPGNLEEKDGECVLPATASIAVSKVGIGALCSELAECDHGSTCSMGRCACLSPLVQHEGKCVLKQQQKLVGPGELCDNGEMCTKGSICDAVIPVCVCPHDTDLSNGECIRVRAVPKPQVPVTTAPTLLPVQPNELLMTIKPVVPTVQTVQTRQPQPVHPVPVIQILPEQPKTPAPTSAYTLPYSNYVATKEVVPVQQYTTTQPPIQVTRPMVPVTNPPKSLPKSTKSNYVKMGGNKQAGVGVRCSLNTDCMIGAYCNGNTNPPSCQCLSTHVNIEGRCEKVVYPGQIGCRSDAQCSAAHSSTSCIDRVCACPIGQKAVDQTCVPANEPVTSPPGGSCSEGRQCTGGAVCKEGWCICPDQSMIVHKGVCIQSGNRPTLPPKFTAATAPAPAVFSTQGRKQIPGSNCGPLDVCVGGSQCISGTCLCPAGTVASQNGRCDKPTTIAVAMPTRPASKTFFSKPGEPCGAEQICVGGSQCMDGKVCQCPSEKAQIVNGECVTIAAPIEVAPGASCNNNVVCTKGSSCISGQCRCATGYIAVSGNCVLIPVTTTTTQKAIISANPLESCDGGETCAGGSSCDYDTGICMCPKGQIVFGTQCLPPPTQATMAAVSTAIPVTAPSTTKKAGCESDQHCGVNKVCVAGQCKCRPGFVNISGSCEPLEDLDAGERPVPVSYAKHKVAMISSEKLNEKDEETVQTTAKAQTTSRQPSRQETQRPRVVGPPIRRPKPKSKSGGGGGGGSSGASGGKGPGSYKTGSGNGNCPPGNDPTKDDSGNLIMCNGLEPNCPPRSYCYITSGGFATEEYNCCKSW